MSAPQLPVIAVSNRKGGVGKSATAVNLAAELAAQGMRVLLIDLDSQGHCAVGLGVAVGKREACVHDIFSRAEARLTDAVRATPYPNLWLAAADQTFDHGSGLRDQDRLAGALRGEALHERFDVVVLDTPPSLDMLLLNALQAARWVLVPFVPHALSFEGIRQLMRVLFKIMASTNRSVQLMGLLPVTVAEHIRQHRQVTGRVTEQFGASRVLAGIRNDIRVAEAFGVGKPVRVHAPGCRAAQDFAALGAAVKELLTPALARGASLNADTPSRQNTTADGVFC